MRVLQITDLHIMPEPNTEIYGVDSYKSLVRVLNEALSLEVKPDLIVATGDLAEDGSCQSYERLRKLFLSVDIPVFVLPGNHDSVVNMEKSLIGGAIQMAPQYFAGGWNFIFLNSQVIGYGHGELRGDQLRELDQTLTRNPQTPTLIAFHHTPLSPCPSPGCRLIGRDALFDLLERRHNAKCVITGHAHEDKSLACGAALVVTTPATCAQGIHAQEGDGVDHNDFWDSHGFDTSRHGYRTLDLSSDGTVTSQVYWVANEQAAVKV